MRSLIFISAALMVAAGIFGFVDYKKKEQSKEFKALYQEEKPVVQQPAPEIISSPAPVIAVKETSEETVDNTKNTVSKKAKKGNHKRIKYSQFSRADIEEPAPPVKELQ